MQIKPLENLINKFKNNKKIQHVIIIALAILIAILLMFNFFTEPKSETKTNSSDEITNYVHDLESRIANTLSKVKDAGDISVVITLESGMETVLAMETVTKETSSGVEVINKPVIVNGKTITLKESYPEIKGVLIVAEGASNFAVLSRLQQAVISLLDIKLEQIEILTMK